MKPPSLAASSSEEDNSSAAAPAYKCFVSFSQPAPSPYDLAISSALEHGGFADMAEDETLIFETPKYDAVANARVRALDEIAYDGMSCTSPDDIIRHCFHEDLFALFQSMVKIANDDTLWKGHLDREGYATTRAKEMCKVPFRDPPPEPPRDEKKWRHPDEIAAEEEAKRKAEEDLAEAMKELQLRPPRVLPVFLYLHPFDEEKGFFSQFRLFFINGMLAGATQVSDDAFLSYILRISSFISPILVLISDVAVSFRYQSWVFTRRC